MSTGTVVQFGGDSPGESRAERIRRTGHRKHTEAKRLGDQLQAACDYARTALAEAKRSGVDATPAVRHAIAAVMACGDAITARVSGGGAP